jgi:hypothetical protein
MKYTLPSALRQVASASRQTATSSVRSQQPHLFRLSTLSSSCINTARSAGIFGGQKSTPQLTSSMFRRFINSSANAKNIALDSAVVSGATVETAARPSAGSLPGLTTPAVANWLYISSGLVFFIIVVGGVTRLTESGLSITEWEPVKGILPPIGEEQWAVEWEKYKVTPEGVITNSQLDMESFKKIFYMEWAHRLAGRVLGVG